MKVAWVYSSQCHVMNGEVAAVSVMLSVFALSFAVSSIICSCEAQYNFTVRFHEFRNPLGLQCGECGNGGPPACCDDVQRFENCNTTRPFNCDNRFRFLLRPFGAPVETAPSTGFPYFTPSNGLVNSQTFTEGPRAFLALPNPFTITKTEEWSGRIQFFIDAIDRDVPMSTSGISETLAIINCFPINLELNPGPNFSERTTYTGIYNISDVGFDISFRVQCLENYYGPNCITFCEPLEGVYICDSEGRSVCLQENRDSTTNCMTCFQGWDFETNCTTCSVYYNNQSDCTQCVAGRDITTFCTTCLPGYDPSSDCTQCLPGIQCQTSQKTSRTTESPKTTEISVVTSATQGNKKETGGPNLALVGGAVGGAFAVTIVICIVLIVIIILMKKKLKSSGRTDGNEDDLATSHKLSPNEKTLTLESDERSHDFDNPIYDEAKEPLASEDVDKLECSSPTAGSDLSPSQKPPPQKNSGALECDARQHEFDNPLYAEAKAPQTIADVDRGKYTSSGPGTDLEGTNKSQTPDDTVRQTVDDEDPALYASVDIVSHTAPADVTVVTGLEQQNEYDVIAEHHNIASSFPSPAGLVSVSSASHPSTGDSVVFSEVGEKPREGEVYNVAYPIKTANRETLNEIVDGYKCLSK